ncbi:IS66 family insertion sequence element accessory protein TnpB [Castellaniella sp.]|uniref:IS66 family insertion sequence element accessory protein TnpB n=1 Tax=Castellaniella sp. TaxID=1955812 RepID=UPI002AFE85A4|nr:IS66 family insertion sequence element accessory protein TnpB [Castellaniella sp.]
MHPGVAIGQVYLCCVPVDFRKQIDGLAALVQSELELDVFGDTLSMPSTGMPRQVLIG